MADNEGGVNPGLIFTKKVSDLQLDQEPKYLLSADNSGNLKKTEYSSIKNAAALNIKGEATPTSSPTTWNPGDPYLFEKWDVKTEGTYTNFKDSTNTPIVITADDLKNKIVQIWVENGISSKYTVNVIPDPATGNLIDLGMVTVGYVGSTGTINNSDTDYRKLKITGLEGEKNYHLSALSNLFHPSESKNLVFFDSTGAFISRIAVNKNILPFTTPANTSYAYMNVYVNADGDDVDQISNYQLNLFQGDAKQDSVKLTSYSNLKAVISNNELVTGDEMTVVSNGTTFRTTVLSENTISENVIVNGYDFAKIDLANDKILATDTLSCIARNSGGVWGFVEDADHTKKGIVSITNNTNSFVINYAKITQKYLP